MNKTTGVAAVLMAAVLVSAGAQDRLLAGVSLMKQSTVRIAGEKVVWIDPYQVSGAPADGDIVLVTHTHGDHFSAAEIRKVAGRSALIIAPADAFEALKGAGFQNLAVLRPGEKQLVSGILIEAVPAYNTNKAYHPKDNQWVGYIVTVNGVRYYHAGDTDAIPEMKDFKADVAFLPVGGTYTMTADEAVTAANLIRPSVAVPMHYGDVVGTPADAQRFASGLASGIRGTVLK